MADNDEKHSSLKKLGRFTRNTSPAFMAADVLKKRKENQAPSDGSDLNRALPAGGPSSAPTTPTDRPPERRDVSKNQDEAEIERTHVDEDGSGVSTRDDDKTPIRADIAAAAQRMTWKLGGRREIRKLAEHLHPGESVEVIVQGTYKTKQGILTLTNHRLLFIFHGLVSEHQEDFPLSHVTSIEHSSGFATGRIMIWAAGAKAEITNVNKSDLKPFVDAARARLAGASPLGAAVQEPPLSGVRAQEGDPLEQIQKLGALKEAGLISAEEFEEKKSELLKRI